MYSWFGHSKSANQLLRRYEAFIGAVYGFDAKYVAGYWKVVIFTCPSVLAERQYS
jgi:hypothetical protein